jgi:hypothetical protein
MREGDGNIKIWNGQWTRRKKCLINMGGVGWGGMKKNMWWLLQNGSCGVYKMSASVYFVSKNKSFNHSLLQFVVTGRISIV